MTPAQAQALADRIALGDLMNRYVDLLDGKHWAGLEQVFTEDAAAHWGPGRSLRGRAAIVAAMRQRLESDAIVTFHHLGSFTPAIEGDTARADVRIRAMHWGVGPRAGRFYESLGTQVTGFARRPEGWRCCDYEWRIAVKLGSMDVFED